MKKYRLLQRLTGIHRIHHIYYSYGWKLPFGWGYFPGYKRYFDKPAFQKIDDGLYHNCTKSGIY